MGGKSPATRPRVTSQIRATRAGLRGSNPFYDQDFFDRTCSRAIPINDGTPRSFVAGLNFIYDEEKYSNGDLLDGKEEITESDDLRKVMEVLQFGDKYMIKSLIQFCQNLLIRKIQLSDDNIFPMFSVISEYEEYTTEFLIVKSQMKQYSELVDIDITKGTTKIKHPQQTQFTFKVNQSCMVLCDLQWQLGRCKNHSFGNPWGCPFKQIVLKSQHGPPEIIGNKNVRDEELEFYVEANTQITVSVQF